MSAASRLPCALRPSRSGVLTRTQLDYWYDTWRLLWPEAAILHLTMRKPHWDPRKHCKARDKCREGEALEVGHRLCFRNRRSPDCMADWTWGSGMQGTTTRCGTISDCRTRFRFWDDWPVRACAWCGRTARWTRAHGPRIRDCR